MMWQLVRNVIFSLIIGLILLNSQTQCSTWKYAVTTPSYIRFFNANWINTSPYRIKDKVMKDISLLAFDESCNILYFVNNDFGTNKKGEIYKFVVGNEKIMKSVISTENTTIRGIAFDSLQGNLYWSNGLRIMQYNDDFGKSTVILEDNETRFPTDIALDTCGNRHDLFYINQHETTSSIEKINLVSGGITVIVTGLRTARSITVDCNSNKIYWLDTMKSTNIRIEEANLDGTGRQVLFKRSAANPIHLASDNDNIYYSSATYKKVIRIGKRDGLRTLIGNNFDGVAPIDILTKHVGTQHNNRVCRGNKTTRMHN